MRLYLDFEKPVAEIEAKIEELRQVSSGEDSIPIGEELTRLEIKAEKALAEIYMTLTPWQKTQVARHQQRPHFLDYCKRLVTDFTPMAGDRAFGEDEAIVGGLGRFRGRSICLIGQEKGSDIESRVKHNFGMARPEGYRKAVRLMELADRFDLPVVSLVDTAGAFPGIEAEERGQAEAIARSTQACLELGVPNVAVIIGEGGSGGAIAIATANTRDHAGACDLQRDLARRRRVDPVAGPEPRSGCRHQHEDHGAGPPSFRHHRHRRDGAARRCASRSGIGHRGDRRCDRERPERL